MPFPCKRLYIGRCPDRLGALMIALALVLNGQWQAALALAILVLILPSIQIR